MKVHNNITDLIGKTPLIKINKINDGDSLIYAKVEFFNPSGSIKDRAAYNMIKDAYDKKIIDKNTVIIEPTSGNTGIGLAMICAVLGNKLILTMPDTMTKERRNILKAYGAQLILTDGTKGMQGAVDKAEELHKEIKNSYIPQQFSNPANPQIHYLTTAKEIYEDTDGKVDIVVAGVGTAGTIVGLSKKLKELNPEIKAVAVEPYSSPLISKGVYGAHKIQGIGANFIPDIYKADLIDEVITVKDEDAIEYSGLLASKEGILAGISSGAALKAAIDISKRPQNKGKTVVAILPDTKMRYLSME